FFVLSDGDNALPLTAAQDHKTVLDGDEGPNTGGMGSYSPAPVVDEAMQKRVMAEIVLPTIEAMRREGVPFQGVLYVGLMITNEGPRVVEFNCRFGDPECQAILPRLDVDLLPLLAAVADGHGLPSSLRWRSDSSICVVLASRGYPGAYETGLTIRGLDEAESQTGVAVFQAGPARAGRQLR